MHFADMLQITDSGISISRHRCAPIGIHDGSKVWAALYRLNRREPKFDREGPSLDEMTPEDRPDANSPPHLVLSPVPFEAWLHAYRLQLHLRDEEGALAKAAKVLRCNNLNILATHCSKAGFDHAMWTLIVEDRAPAAKHEAEDLARTRFGPDGGEVSKELVQRYTREAYAKADKIRGLFAGRDCLLTDEQSKNAFGYINHDKWFVDQDTANNSAAYKRHKTMPVDCFWLDHLAYLWLKASKEVIPSFRYSYSDQFLESQEPAEFRKMLTAAEVDTPGTVLGMFNRKEHYVRIGLPRSATQGRAINVRVNYTWSQRRMVGKPSNPGNYKDTRGLLYIITRILGDHGFNLLYLDNALETRKTDHTWKALVYERGSVTVTSHLPPSWAHMSAIEVEIALQSLLNRSAAECAERHGYEGIRLQFDTYCNEVVRATMFLSTRYGYWEGPRRPRLDIVRSEMTRVGYWPTTANGDVKDLRSPMHLSEDAQLRIENAAAFFQIIPRLNSERDTLERLQWIMYERGIAMSVGIPCAYCVQVDHRRRSRDIEFWKSALAVQGDTQLYTFDAEVDDESFRQQIREPIAHLAARAVR